MPHDVDAPLMRRALELAARGEGLVEPNPMVGCVVARDGEVVGEGWHERFGGPHAEVNALAMAGEAARGADIYVTLEPCRHHGKTPPCTQALIAARVARVVVAVRDPFREVNGGGVRELEEAGVSCEIGVGAHEARRVLAPYLKLTNAGRPWVIAKWAMTLDGKIATASGASRWISSTESRALVHQLRGRMDAVIVGAGTARADDPLLTARPAGPRVATRVVLGPIADGSRLAATLADAPVISVADADAPRGVELLHVEGETRADRLAAVLDELGRRRMTNVLVEGGAAVLGAALDGDLIDEVHVFIAPKLAGAAGALSPIGGRGADDIASALRLTQCEVATPGGDVYVRGRVDRAGARS